MQPDIPTLLVVLVVSNVLIAGALWATPAGALRAGLGLWGGALVAQAAAWLILLAPHHASYQPSLVIAGVLLVYGGSLQASAVLKFGNRTPPDWLLYGPPVAAFFGLSIWLQPDEPLPRIDSVAALAWWLLAFHALTVYASFAFLLVHKLRAQGLADTDPLTGAYNRRMFGELAERELSRARRDRTSVSLLALELDRFKRVNDDYGHAAGDEVLASVAALVRKCLRKEDVLARYGGEEFVVLLPGAGHSAAAALAERIRTELEHTRIRAADHDVRITVSIGVAAERGESAPSLATILRRADEALYEAKSKGRNRVVTFETPVAVAA